MRLAPLLLLLLPLVLVLVQLLLRWGLQRRTELLRSAHSYRPLRRQETPVVVEVDVDSSPLFDSPAPEGAQPHYLVLDTETQDVLHGEEVGEEMTLSPLILLSWQVLDAAGACLSEETHLIRRTSPITAEATSLHGISTEEMEAEGEDLRLVLERFLRVVREVKVLVAHNVRFHRTLLLSELEAVGLPSTSLEKLPQLCTMERGRVLGFKRSSSGEAMYPKLSELFGYLYLHQPEVHIRFHQKGLRDVRLLAACLRQLIV
ncbi:3'-5' exonuclease [uncultured Porphyromonas sp.]|uniref:3'-5' exonuclease n=1 Tax=uncultured Porphyromonas sp. TaxID=159274 RepID=UPI00262A163D|nr:3'-5' exonuclease [uncultured Porphyromonas sp.]